jgi:hypothetical protein
MTFGGGNLRGQNIHGVAKPVTAENSGDSNNQLTFNLLNAAYFAKNGLVRQFSVYAHPHQMSYLRPALLYIHV